MSAIDSIREARHSPGVLEDLYQSACRDRQEGEFTAQLFAVQAEFPENILLQAWYFRFKAAQALAAAAQRGIDWARLIPLCLLSGLACYGLSFSSMPSYPAQPSTILLFWAPLVAVFVIIFLALVTRRNVKLAIGLVAGLAIACGYVSLQIFWHTDAAFQQNYYTLMLPHLPLLAWVAVGWSAVGMGSNIRQRFAFLSKSLDVFITAGLYVIAGVAFVMITAGLFQALNISIPDPIIRLMAAGGGGMIPLLAVASAYDPHTPPAEQDRQHGLSKVIASLMQVLLPLSILVLVIYIAFIPFNFNVPFNNRDVLIIYNILLFAIMSLLIGVGPIRPEDLSKRTGIWLRRGVNFLAALVVAVNLYALTAVTYRAVNDGLTMNRVAVIGWNTINIAILVTMLVCMVRWGKENWIDALHSAFSFGIWAYMVWGLFLVLMVPWLFG